MLSKNNRQYQQQRQAQRVPHYGIRKLSVGVASVLISTTLYMGATSAKADTLPSTATDTATTKPETISSSSSTQDNTTVDKIVETTVPKTVSSTDTSVSTTPNAQASTTNTTAGATSSDKSSANSNSLVTNNVESTANTTAQTQPKPDVVTSDKANVDNQVGSNVENKATTTTDTISAPTTPKRVVRRVRSLAATSTTDSNELVENKDYTVSNVSLEDHKKQDNFDEDATFLHADINLKDGNAIANKQITVTFNKKEFGEFWNFKNQDLIYNDQVIGNLVGDARGKKFKISFNDNTRGLKDINLSLKVYLSDNPYDMRDLYTNNQAKNNEKYTVRHNYQIGSTNYYVDREATIHYVAEAQPVIYATEQFGKPISFWYAPQEWIQLDITYFTARDGKTYAQINGIPGKEIGYNLGLGKGFITPDTKSVTISFEPSSKYYSKDANKLKISDNATFDEQTVTYRTQYDSNDLVAGFTDVYTTRPKDVNEVSNKHTYYVKDLIKLDGNTLIATNATTSTGLNNLSSRAGYKSGYVGLNDANYTVVSSDDLRKFVVDNIAKIIETRGEFLTSNSDYSNPGRIVAHNNTTGQDVYYELHNKVRVNNRNVTTPPDGAILVSAGKDIPTKVYSYTSTDIPSNVDKSKLTKEVTRTINVHNPNGTVDTTVQKVTYHQTVTVAGDEVIYNNDWTTADDTNWSEFDVPQIANYRASKDKVYGQWIGGVNTQNQTVDITYTANEEKEKTTFTHTFHWVDKLTGETIAPDTVITIDYERTNVPAENKYGDWAVVPDSLRQTGTKVNVTYNKTATNTEQNTDIYTLYVHYPSIPNKGNVSYYSIYGQASVSDIIYRAAHKQGPTSTTDHSVRYNHVMNTTVKFVDDDNNGENVGHKDIRGEVGEKSTADLPENYELVDGQSNTVTFAADTPAEMTVHLKHKIEKTSEEKTVTRTIKVTDPTGKVTTVPQTAKITRNVSTDKVTNQKTYGDWTTSSFDAYEVPTIDGYTANKSQVDAVTVNGDTTDQTVDISYTANDRSTQIVFVDNDGEIVDTVNVNGKTGETVETNAKVPDKWKLVDNETVPSTVTFSADTPEKITVHVEHKVETRQLKINTNVFLPRLIKFGDDTSFDNHGYALWINSDEFNSKQYYLGAPVNVGPVTGSVQYDLVSGKIVKINNGETLKLDKTLFNYPSDNDVANGGSLGELGENATKTTLTDYLNKFTHENLNYKVYASANLTKDLLADKDGVISHYFIHDNEILPFTFENGKQYGSDYEIDTSTINNSFSIDFNDLVNNFASYDIHENDDGSLSADTMLVTPIAYQPYISKTVTRTINVTNPDGTVKTVKQTAEINQNVRDEFDWKGHHGDYLHKGDAYVTDNNWSTYEVPDIPGYTASQKQVDEVAVNGGTTDQVVNISYTANKQSVNVNYVDVNNGNKVVHVTTVNGVTAGDATVANELPTGYKLVDGQSVPKTIHFNANNNDDINVKVQHATVTVTPDSPKTPSDKLPDNPGKSYPSGVAKDDLTKTVTRKVVIVAPDGKQTVTNQTVTFTRNATVDEVTGNVTYGSWSENGKHEFATVNVPTVPGYTATGDVPSLTVTPDSKDITVTINYTANEQSTQIVFVDKNGKTVDTVTVNGKTGDTVKTNAKVPDGWKLVGNEVVPSQVTFTGEGVPNKKVTVDHATVTVTPDSPKTPSDKLPDNPGKSYPSGVAKDDLVKTVTRTIKVTDPTGKATTETQTVHLTRIATVDEVTGNITYGDWTTGSFDGYDVPTVPGYTASQTSVAATPVDENTKDQTVEVSYTPNKQSTTVKYVDDKGQVVHTTTVNGVTGQTVNVPSEVPAGWMITKGEVPSEITFGADGHEPIEVTVEHHHITVTPDHPQTNGTKLPDNPAKTFNGVEANDLNKTITRTIKVTTPDSQTKTVTQTVKLTRTANVDEVTGEVAYGNWTTSEWAAYNAPSVAGYTPSQAKVDKETVTAALKDTTVEITYTPNQHQISVEYVDDDAHGKIVKTDQVPGKTDQTITVTPSAPANYDLVDNGNRTYTVTSDDGQAVQIHVKHHQVTTSESKAVTRTINVHATHNGLKTVKQTVDLTRDVTTDQVTGEKTYGDWATGQWKAYTPEAISGYTPSTSEVPSANIDGSSTDQTVDITYTANTQKVEIVYVDDAKGVAVVKTDQIAGKTDETVKVTPDIPAGYKVVGKVPGDYTMTADGHQAITVHLVHQMKTASESKAVTRTINVHTPHDGTTVVKQTVELTRDVTTDQVTGDKTYGDWSVTKWTHYDVPVVAGYVPSIKQVAQQVVNGMTTDQTIDVTYSSGEHTTHINYVDGDGNVVHTTVIKGQTDGTSQVPNETPTGWTVVGKQVPTELAFGPEGHTDVTVTVDHQHVTVTPDNPKAPTDKLPDNPAKTYPNGVGHDDLNKTVTRTVKVTTPDGQTKTATQTAKLTRTADVDEVTGKIAYGKWTTGEWSSYDVPAVPGYTASQSEVTAVKITADTKNQTITVTYTANDQTTHINYVDSNGKIIYTTTVTGKTDQTVKVPNEVPTGWTITDGQVPSEVTFGANGNDDVTVTVNHRHVTVTPDKPQTDGTKLPNNPRKTFHGVSEINLNKIVTRTIEVASPARKTTTVKQTAKLTRTADVDEVTGEVTYGKWTTDSWSIYTVPTVAGYTPSQTVVAEVAVDANTADQTVKIAYTADSHNTHINYVDKDGNVVHTTTVTGATDQTVKVPNETPAGWKVTGDQVPSEVTFDASGHDDVAITIDHQHVTVTPDNPKTTGEKLPDNPAKTYPNGVGYNDLNKTITRTIKVTTPDGQTKTVEQTAKLTRTADVDEATGAVTYGDWSTGQWSAFVPPVVDGYTPSLPEISSQAVTAENKDQTITITYAANPQTAKIQYKDKAGTILHEQIVHGKTGETVKVPSEVPAGWRPVNGQKVPANITYGAQATEPVTVTVEHATVTVQPNQPKTPADSLPDDPTKNYPSGVGVNDLNQTLTRTITINAPGQAPQTITQPAHLMRSATVDEVTGEVTYSDWSTDKWPAVTVPSIPGYTPNVATISAQTVTDETKPTTITVNYEPNEHTTQIQYVDDKGAVIKTVPLHGVTGETVYVPKNLPAGWILTPTTKVPETITMTANGHPKVVVTVQHGKVTVIPDHPKTTADLLPDNPNNHYPAGVDEPDLNKTLTRKIDLTVPGQKTRTITQTVTVRRSATVDEVTGKVTYSSWSTTEWTAVNVPSVLGYTPSTETIPAQTITDKIKNTTVTVNYTADEHTTQLQYVNEQGNVVETLTLQGRTGETVTVPTTLPAGWVLTPNTKLPATITMTANGHPKVVATVQHGKVTVTPDHPKTTADTLPNNPNRHYPTGVGENDLNQTLTRTINLTVPGQKTRTITQTVTVHRSATVDEVTGEITYSDWSTAEWPEVTVPSIQGYTPNQTKIPAETAKADRGDQTITIAYHKDSVSNKSEKQTSAVKLKTVEPTKTMPATAMATTAEKHHSETKSMPTKATNSASTTLPQTGDAKNAATWLGVINMLFTGLVGWWTKKKRKPQA